MRERAEAMVLASFAADSHALGAHCIYDMREIASRYGRIERLMPPPPDSPHAGRSKGSFTDYGEQALTLLRHLAARRSFDAQSFAEEWRVAMRSAPGSDGRAASGMPANPGRGTEPSQAMARSGGLAATARIAPLAYLYRDEREELVRTATLQTRVSDDSAPVVAVSAFLARVLWNVLNGKTPGAAIRSVLDLQNEPAIAGLVVSGLESVDHDTAESALAFGQSGSIASALPLSVHLIAKYEGSLKDALVENVGVGGDSAARAMIVGMVLGAFHGSDAIPDDWIEEMRAYREISALLEDLEAVLQRTVHEAADGPTS